jgi:hypothetical protein
MKTEKQAELARDQHAEFLRKKGAHAISVEKVTIAGHKQFAVVAMFDDKSKAAGLPSNLGVKTDKGESEVPLVIQEQEPFQLE